MKMDVIPAVGEIHVDDGKIPLKTLVAIAADESVARRLTFLGEFVHDLSRLGLDAKVHCCEELDDLSTRILLHIDEAKPLGDEGYELSVESTGVSIVACEPAGAFYALQTLYAMLSQAMRRGQQSLCYCKIIDKPRFSWRGFMLDCARTFQPVDRVKRIVDLMARLKMNVLHWHVTDSQGWAVESKKFPKLNVAVNSGWSPYYTQEDVREIVEYARQRFITVVPEIEMPSHCHNALVSYPEYACPNQLEEGVYAAYCIGRQATVEFLKDVLRETVEVFDSPFVHIGGDERPANLWSQCPYCSSLIDKLGLRDEDQLQNWFMNEMTQFVHNELGRTTIAWAENLKDGYPQGQIVQGWRTGSSEEALALGAKVVNSFHEHAYLDYPQTEEDAEVFCDWMELMTLEKVYEFDPVPEGTPKEKASLVLGAEAPLWTSFTPDEQTLYYQMLPRLVAFAEVIWSSPKCRDFGEFQQRLTGVQAWLTEDGTWPEFEGKPDFTSVFPKK